MNLPAAFHENHRARRTVGEKLRARKFARGQAIYLALGAIVFLALMTFATYNISQMTHSKAQTLNAADAGAYTLANTVARDLNFMAYSNRAMVANHAVVGQLVSLASLSEMLYLAASDISLLQNLAWIPYVGPILEAIGEAFEAVAQAIDEYVLPALEEITEIQNVIIQAISWMQYGVHAVTAADVLKVDEVIKANDPELRWATTDGGGALIASANNVAGIVETFLGGFTDQRSDDDAKDRMREVVNVSRDGFTVTRAWVPIPSLPYPLQRKTKTVFNGGTQLSSDNKTWVGVDGLDIQYKECCKWNGSYRSREIKYWLTGEVAGSSGANDWKKLSHGALSSGAHRDAYDNRKKRLENTYSGIQPYYELTDDPSPGEHPSPTFVVLVYKPIDNNGTPNANKTFQTTDPNNPFHLDEGRAKIYGVAAAQAYFRRPATSDGDKSAGNLPNTLYRNGTYATLFSPYWQPRLTDLPAAVTAGLLITADH